MAKKHNPDELLLISGTYKEFEEAMAKVADEIIKAVKPVLNTITALLHNAEFQAIVIEALEKKLAETPVEDVATRSDLQAEIKTWRKYQKEGNK